MATSIEALAPEDARGRISLLDPTREYDAHILCPTFQRPRRAR